MDTSLTKAKEIPFLTDTQILKYLDNLGLTSKLTASEKDTYLQICKAYQLNPFKREIHVSKYGEGAKAQMSIITGYEVYLKRAERTGLLDGWKVETIGSVESNDLKGVLTIYRKDMTHPFTWEVDYEEFVQTVECYGEDGRRNGQFRPTNFWKKKNFMIKKVAISQGFRICFSDELGGMPYTKEEMPEPEITPHVDLGTTTIEVAPDRIKVIKAEVDKKESVADLGTYFKGLNSLEQNNQEVKDHVNAKKKTLSSAAKTTNEEVSKLTPEVLKTRLHQISQFKDKELLNTFWTDLSTEEKADKQLKAAATTQRETIKAAATKTN